jgi:hypothetical protein
MIEDSLWKMSNDVDWAFLPLTDREKEAAEQAKQALAAALPLPNDVYLNVKTGTLRVELVSDNRNVSVVGAAVAALAQYYGVEATPLALQTPMANHFARLYREALTTLEPREVV